MYSGEAASSGSCAAGGGHGDGVRFGGKGCRGEEGEFAGAGDAVGGAEAGLRVFVRGIEAVAVRVVEAHVHLGRVRRPEPGDEFCGGAGGVLHFERGGKRLPEVLDADGEAAAEIAGIGEARRARAGVGVKPGALRVGALDDGEAVGGGLDELEVVPDGVLEEDRIGVNGWPVSCATLPPPGCSGSDHRPPSGPAKRTVRFARLVAHGHVDLQAEAAHEILLLVAVEDDGVDDADGGLAAVEVEANGEGQPLALGRVPRCMPSILTTARTGPDCSTVTFFTSQRNRSRAGESSGLLAGPVLQDADELARAGDRFAVCPNPLDQVRTGVRDRALHRARFHHNRAGVICNLDAAGCGRLSGCGEAQWAGKSNWEDGGKAHPFGGAVRPGCERPTLQGKRSAIGVEAEVRTGAYRTLGPGNSPTNASRQGQRLFAK